MKRDPGGLLIGPLDCHLVHNFLRLKIADTSIIQVSLSLRSNFLPYTRHLPRLM